MHNNCRPDSQGSMKHALGHDFMSVVRIDSTLLDFNVLFLILMFYFSELAKKYNSKKIAIIKVTHISNF